MEPSRHLLIFIGGHFANAPRSQKEAAVAVASGFRVTVMGTWFDRRLAAEDHSLAKSLGVTFAPLLDLTRRTPQSWRAKIAGRLATFLYRKTGVTLPEAYGLTARHMVGAARKSKPDLIMVHSEAGLWAGAQLLRLGFKVGVDFEDWFSEDLPHASRHTRPVKAMRKLEHHLLRNAHLSLTTTTALSNALLLDASCDRSPLAIPNAFPIVIDRSEFSGSAKPGDPVRFYWFSQTIGPGRGLELLAPALAEITGPWELHLRGNLRHYSAWFEETFQDVPPDRITIHPAVPNQELSHASSRFDVGLALEGTQIRSRDLTATNKIFEYFRSNLAVITTDTAGQREVMKKCPGAGLVVPAGDSKPLAAALQFFIDHPDSLEDAKDHAFEAAASTWSWSRFAPQLGEALESAVRQAPC